MLDIDDLLARRTLHEDACVVVIDKPAGLAVQRGTGTSDDLDSRLAARAGRTGERLRLTHRLDRDTSGCLVLARSRTAAARMGRHFMKRRVAKSYLAVTCGVPDLPADRIELPLLKARVGTRDRMRAATADEIARGLAHSATTCFEVLREAPGRRFALLALNPLTGRQHQLRAHLALAGTPILGDLLYGSDDVPAGVGRLQLHASAISFPAEGGRRIEAVAPLPADMRHAMSRLGLGTPLHGAAA